MSENTIYETFFEVNELFVVEILEMQTKLPQSYVSKRVFLEYLVDEVNLEKRVHATQS